MNARSIHDPDRDSIAALLDGEPRYRLDQLWHGLYVDHLPVSAITTLPASLRSRIASLLPEALVETKRSVSDDGDTVKFLWRLVEGNHPIETVLMYYDDRATVCVSTQAGCAMACGFCATGQAGFSRHLTVGEIVEQVVRCAREAGARDRRIDNIVFMGMGEPLANRDALWGSIERIHGDMGVSARHLTVSTVGIVPGISWLARQPLPVNLAVSLHAANDRLRDELVPVNRRHDIASLMEACRDYLTVRNRRITFEWALIEATNDSRRDADELADLCLALAPAAHVNLIPLNPTPGWPTVGSSPERVDAFRGWLRSRGVNATVRQNRGTEIDAACGQLAAGQPVNVAPPRTQLRPR